MNHPEFKLDHRLMLDKINLDEGTALLMEKFIRLRINPYYRPGRSIRKP